MATTTSHPLICHIRRLAGDPLATNLPDPQLLARFAASGDEGAFALLVRRHGPLVLGVCRRVLDDWHAAEDAFQDVFILLARKAGSLRQPERLGPWLHGVAHRTALKARTRAARRRACERQAAAPPAVEPPDLLMWRDLRPVLDDAVARLPEKHRLPFVLHYLQGEAVDAVAGRLGWPRGTVATRLARARAQLRKGLARRGVTLSAAGLAALSAGTATAVVPPRLVAGVVRAVTPSAAGTVLLQGGLNAMVPMKWKSMMAAVLIAAAASMGAGLLSAGAREDRPAPAAVAPPVAKGGAQPASADDIEEQIYRALREQGCWHAGGGYTLFVKRLEKRQLVDVAIVNRLGLLLSKNQQQPNTHRWMEGLRVLKNAGEQKPVFARARSATLHVDLKAGHVLVEMREALVDSGEDRLHTERLAIPLPLPGAPAVVPAQDGRAIVEEKYRQYQINLQLVQVDARGKDLGAHGKGKVHAEPRLMAREDQEASFISGGEVAVPGVAAGSTEYLSVGYSVRVKINRAQDGSLRLDASFGRSEVEKPGAQGWRLRTTSVRCVERVKLGEEVKLVEKDSTGRPLHWVLIRVVREESVQSRTESRAAKPAKAKRQDDALAGILVQPDMGSVQLGREKVKRLPEENEESRRPDLSAYVIQPPDVLRIEAGKKLAQAVPGLTGEHLVRPDGTIGLDTYGSVHVAGLTMDQAAGAVAAQLRAMGAGKGQSVEQVRRELAVEVSAFNSQVCYVIVDIAGRGQQVYRLPLTGKEAVVDMVAQIEGLPAVASRSRLMLVRPAGKAGARPDVLRVNWEAITRGGQSGTNYQLRPGDRLFIVDAGK